MGGISFVKLFSRLRKDVTDKNARDTTAQAQSHPSEDSSNSNRSSSESSNEASQKNPQTDSSTKKINKSEADSAPQVSNSDKSNNQIVSVHDKRVKIEKDMNSLSHEYAQLRGKLKLNLFSERDDYQSKLNSLTKQLHDLQDNEKAVQEQLENNRNENDGKETERLAGIRADQKHQNELLYKYKEQQKTLAGSIEKNDKQLASKQTQLAKNQKEEADLSNEIKNETDLQKMLALMEKQKSQIDKIYKSRQKINDELADIQSELGNNKKDLNDVNVNINEISSSVALLKTKINQVEQNIQNNRA